MVHKNKEQPLITSQEPLDDHDPTDDPALHLYQLLIEHEAMPPDMSEEIRAIHLSDAERARLAASGISEVDIISGSIRRGDLMDAGYVFNNRIGGGEKSLLSETSWTFLTQPELDAIVATQKQPTDLEATRLDMLDTLVAAYAAYAQHRHTLPNLQQDLLGASCQQLDQFDLNKEERARVEAYIKDAFSKQYAIPYVMDELCSGLVPPPTVGAVPIDIFATRSQALQGTPSPFLDSGFHFGDNLDITLYPDDADKTRRLNSVVVHLLSRGVNQTGSSRNGSHDQTYLTATEFRTLQPLLQDKTMALATDYAPYTVALRILARSNVDYEKYLPDHYQNNNTS